MDESEIRWKQMLTIAIDPGVNGGICWRFEGKTTAMRMPPTDFEIAELLARLARKCDLVEAYIEKPPLFAGRNIPGSAVGKMMFNFGVVLGVSMACGFKVHRVRPQTWQKTHPVGTKGDLTTTQWKNKLKGRAQELFPTCDVTLKTADALLILDSAVRGVIN